MFSAFIPGHDQVSLLLAFLIILRTGVCCLRYGKECGKGIFHTLCHNVVKRVCNMPFLTSIQPIKRELLRRKRLRLQGQPDTRPGEAVVSPEKRWEGHWRSEKCTEPDRN